MPLLRRRLMMQQYKFNTVKGVGSISLLNTAKGYFKRFALLGNSMQPQTTGVQLIEFPYVDSDVTKDGLQFTVLKNGGVKVAGTSTAPVYFMLSRQDFGNESVVGNAKGNGKTFSGSNNGVVLQYHGINKTLLLFFASGKTYNTVIYPQVQNGDVATPYEPYTGCKPSPSPEYLQEIKSAGKYDEASGKYLFDVKITGKNLFDLKRIKNGFVKSTGNGFDIAEDNAYPKSIYLDIIIPLKAGQTLNISGVEQDACRIRVKHDTGRSYYLKYTANKDTEIIICFYGGLSEDDKRNLMIEISDEQTPYEPYTEQTVQIALDEPLRDIGEYKDTITKDGVARRIKQITVDEKSNLMFYRESKNTVGYLVKVPDATQTNYIYSVISDRFVKTQYIDNNDTNGVVTLYAKQIIFRVSKEIANSVDALKEWLANNNITFNYVLESPIIEPLSDENRVKLESLYINDGSTTIMVDGGEVQAGIEVEYAMK